MSVPGFLNIDHSLEIGHRFAGDLAVYHVRDCHFFLGTLFYNFIGPDAVDLVKMPFGLDLPVGATHRTLVFSRGIRIPLGNCRSPKYNCDVLHDGSIRCLTASLCFDRK